MKRILLCLGLCAAAALGGEGREPTTGILGAFGDEVDLLVDQLKDPATQEIEGLRFWTGTLRGRRVAIALSGVGKVNAAVAAMLLHEHFRPAEMLFTGIAGALNPGLRPGDIVIAAKTVQHDYGTLTAEGFRRKAARNPVTRERNPVFFPADARLLKLALAAKDRVKLDPIEFADGPRVPRISQGVVATGDVFVAHPGKKAELRKELAADAVEMEGAAVAQVCWQWEVPCLVIRSMSDMADHNAVVDAQTFQAIAARNSAHLVAEIVGQLK